MQYMVGIGIEPPDDGERSGVSVPYYINKYCSLCINTTDQSYCFQYMSGHIIIALLKA